MGYNAVVKYSHRITNRVGSSPQTNRGNNLSELPYSMASIPSRISLKQKFPRHISHLGNFHISHVANFLCRRKGDCVQLNPVPSASDPSGVPVAQRSGKAG
jgi:hypothetical protein